MKCKICGAEFQPEKDRHYICREGKVTALSTINRQEEPKVFDAFDCPICGCQVIAQERKVNIGISAAKQALENYVKG